MTIKRTIDGREIEIELTEQELTNAYFESEHLWDVKYLCNVLEYVNDEKYPVDEMRQRLESDPELRSRVAYRYRKYLDDCVTGEDEIDCFLYAYEYCTEV